MADNDLAGIPIPGAPISTQPTEGDPLADQKAAFQTLLAAQREQTKLESGVRDSPLLEEKPKKSAKAAAKPAEKPAAEVETEAPAAPAIAAKPEVSHETEKLRAKLLLAGFPKEAIESTTEDKLRSWWQGQEEREQARAAALQRASDLEKRFTQTTSKPAEPSDEGVPTAEEDLDDIAKELSDQFGEDEAGALLKAVKKLVEPYRAKTDRLEAFIESARKRGAQDISQRNRARLAEKMPMLKDNDRAWSLIHSHVEQVFQNEPNKHSSAEAAFDDIYQAIYGGIEVAKEAPASAPDPDRYAEEKARIAASAPTVPDSHRHQKVSSPTDRAFAAFKVLRKNPEDLEGAQRAYGVGPAQ